MCIVCNLNLHYIRLQWSCRGWQSVASRVQDGDGDAGFSWRQPVVSVLRGAGSAAALHQKCSGQGGLLLLFWPRDPAGVTADQSQIGNRLLRRQKVAGWNKLTHACHFISGNDGWLCAVQLTYVAGGTQAGGL